jgi:hypothetical protein
MQKSLALLVGLCLAGCQTGSNPITAVLGPSSETIARNDFDKSVAAYRNCTAVKPANACEPERQVMLANQQVLSAEVSRPHAPNPLQGYRFDPQQTTCTRTLTGMNCTTF